MSAAATTYRPQRFAEVVGQTHIVPVLRAMVVRGTPPPALLFTGSRGTGKTTCGRIFAAALNCSSPKSGDACKECPSCVDVRSGSSVAVIEVDAASHGLVDDIRNLRDAVLTSHPGKWRVVLLDEAHSMSKEAFNALLKTLEEPPAGTTFVLLTTEPHKILPTVRSRSMLFDFRRLTVDEIVGRLEEIEEDAETPLPEEVLGEIARRAEGGMRDAVMLLDQAQHGQVRTAEQLRALFGWEDHSAALFSAALDTDIVTLHRIADAVFRESGDASALVRDLVLYTRDLLLRAAGGEVDTTAADAQEQSRLAARIPVARLVAVMKVLWDAEDRLRADGASQRAALALVVTMFADAIASVAELPQGAGASVPMQTAQTAQPAPTRLTLQEMQELAMEAYSQGR